MDKLKVSVAMAAFNGSQFIEEQVLSILQQSRQPDELIIVDDYSSDNTWQIIKRLENQYPQTIHSTRNQTNIGYVATFNLALSKVSGDLIFLSDQDDLWYSNKVEEVLGFCTSNPHYEVIQHDVDLVNGSLHKSDFSFFGQIESVKGSVDSAVLGCAMAIRYSFLNKCLPIPADFTAHDTWIDEFAKQFRVKGILPLQLMAYRRHNGNESTHILFSQKKLSPIDYKLNYYSNIFKRDKKVSLERRLIDRRLIQSRFLEWNKVYGVEYENSIKLKLNDLQQEISSLKARVLVKNQSFGLRLIGFTQLALNGGYKNNLGIKSYLRDILNLS